MNKLAIIVPYRDRKSHLDQFIPYMNEYLNKNLNNDFVIVIVEQSNNNLFNRGTLINIGFDLIKDKCNYISPHDVDLLPEDADYSLPIAPTHLAAYRSQKDYKLEYEDFFGGVNLFLNEDFKKINGFSNFYAGYGAEDDDIRYRCIISGLEIKRRFSRYTSLYHEPITSATKENEKLWYSIKRGQMASTIKFDGLNTIKYNLINKVESDYIHYFVNFENERYFR